jgi:hypothetical protein
VAFHTLEIEEEYDFEIIGVSSHEKDYRLAWSLNKHMGWRLKRKNDIEIRGKRSVSVHAQYSWVHPVDQTVFTLIDNKTPDGVFMPDMAQFDYILKIEQSGEVVSDAFYQRLRNADFVLAIQLQDVDKLKFKNNLLEEGR